MVYHDALAVLTAKQVWVVLPGVLGAGVNDALGVVAENVIPKG
jgi:hypothetical protein